MHGVKRFALLGLLVAPALGSLVASCVLDGFNRGEEPTPTSLLDAGPADADGGEDSDAAVDCVHAGFPSQPDATPGGTISFVVAVRAIDANRQSDGGPVGVDLDRTCSCQGQEASCVGSPDADVCDLPEGRDNQFRRLFDALGYAAGQLDVGAYYSELAEQGHWSLLLRVSDYNGQPDDSRVEVALFIPHGFPGVDAGPTWTGFDEWLISGDSVGYTDAGDGGYDLAQPIYVDENAFVRDRVLVAGMPSAKFIFGGSTTRMELEAIAINLMGEVERTDAGLWALSSGLLTGVLPVDNVFAALGSFRDNAGNPVCTNDVAYAVAKSLICNGADLEASLLDPKLPCDALSMGLAFEAVEAKLGEVVPPEPASPGCAASVDPAFDSCPESR